MFHFHSRRIPHAVRLTVCILPIISLLFPLNRVALGEAFQDSPALSTSSISAEVLAFPGAEGFGAHTVGGRGGRVIEVTSMDDSGDGTLRAAIEEEGPRIIVFRRGGTIELLESIEIENPFVTIAGQTAPGGGITIKNHPSNLDSSLKVETHDVIIRHLRIRPGPSDELSSTVDALTIGHPHDDVYNVIVDHASFSWATDENVQIWYDARDITIQWSIISEALDCSSHAKGCHSKGLLIGSGGSGRISIHHNLFAHNVDRNPMVSSESGTVDIVNNVIYNYGHGIGAYDNLGETQLNIVGNYFKKGRNTDSERSEIKLHREQNGHGHAIYLQGNIGPNRLEDSLPEDEMISDDAKWYVTSTRHDAPPVTTTSAETAFEQVISSAGATLPERDWIDYWIVQDVLNKWGWWADDLEEVHGWTYMVKGSAPLDTDNDGMPNEWEGNFSLNPDEDDGPLDNDGDGFTNVEEYLNGTDPSIQEEIPPATVQNNSSAAMTMISGISFGESPHADEEPQNESSAEIQQTTKTNVEPHLEELDEPDAARESPVNIISTKLFLPLFDN